MLDVACMSDFQKTGGCPRYPLFFCISVSLCNLGASKLVIATIQKMTGETPEVRSDKRKQREERGEREKKRDIEKN